MLEIGKEENCVISWKSCLDTEINSIDKQHKELILKVNSLINHLGTSNLEGSKEALRTLIEFSKAHIEEEEKSWKEHLLDDSLLIHHKISHMSLLSELERLQNTSDCDLFEDLKNELFSYLVPNFILHILNEDIHLARVIQEISRGRELHQSKALAASKKANSAYVLIDIILSFYGQSLKSNNIRELKIRELTLQQEKLNYLAITDEVSGLYNRRKFNSAFEEKFTRAQLENSPIGLLFIDIDNFKALNDTLGHREGDLAIGKLGLAIKKLCTGFDKSAFRIGGDEFSVVIENTCYNNMMLIAESIRNAAQKILQHHASENSLEPFSVSIGVAVDRPINCKNEKDLFDQADKALYMAKKKGRNCICKFSDI